MSLKMFASFVIKSMDIRFGIIIILGELINCLNCQRFDFLPKGQDCPLSKEEWEKRSNARSCNSNTPYHCLKNQDGELGEVCVKRSMVEIGYCPIYLTSINVVDFRHCKPFGGYTCATEAPFISNTSYLYQACLRFPISVSRYSSTVAPPVTTTAAASEDSSLVAAIVIILLLIVIIVGGILVWRFYLRKNYNCQIPIPFTGGAITICHKDEKEPGDSEEQISLVGSDKKPGKTQSETPLKTKIKRSNPNFVETKNYREIIKMLEKNNVVLVVGNTGMGKSATCVGVLEHYRDMLEWKTIHFPLDPLDKVGERTIVLVDVTFGDLSLYSRYDSNIENMMNRLYTSTRECKEYKLLITCTSSSSFTNLQTNFPILKGCSELNMSYSTSDLKDLNEKYTKPKAKLNDVNETEDKSKERSKSDQVKDKDNASKKAKTTFDQGDDKPGLAYEKDQNEAENQTHVGLNSSDSIRSTKSEEDYPKSSIDPKNLQESAERDDKIIVGEHEQSSTEGTGIGNEDDKKPARYPEIENYCPPSEEDGETDPLNVELEITDNHGKSNAEENEKLEDKAEETSETPNVSEFGLPVACYLPVKVEWNVQYSEALDVMSMFHDYVKSLADSDRQKYGALVYIMLNGSIVDSKSLHKKLLSVLDKDLNQGRFDVRVNELVEVGILHKKGSSYFFNNDLLLFAVIHSFASQNIRTFLEYCYLPFILQFLRTKSTRSSKHFEIEVDDGWKPLCGLAPVMVQRQREKGDEFQNFEPFKTFKEKLDFHEKGTMEFYEIKDKDMTDKKGNVYVRKMVEHYPELKEYYSLTEPKRYKSIKDFKSTTKQHPPCSLQKI